MHICLEYQLRALPSTKPIPDPLLGLKEAREVRPPGGCEPADCGPGTWGLALGAPKLQQVLLRGRFCSRDSWSALGWNGHEPDQHSAAVFAQLFLSFLPIPLPPLGLQWPASLLFLEPGCKDRLPAQERQRRKSASAGVEARESGGSECDLTGAAVRAAEMAPGLAP